MRRFLSNILGAYLATVAGCALIAPRATEAIAPRRWDEVLVAIGADIEAAFVQIVRIAGWFF